MQHCVNFAPTLQFGFSLQRTYLQLATDQNAQLAFCVGKTSGQAFELQVTEVWWEALA